MRFAVVAALVLGLATVQPVAAMMTIGRRSAATVQSVAESESRPWVVRATQTSAPFGVRTGTGSWYCCTRGHSASEYVAAAGPRLRIGNWRGRYVWVSSGTRRIRVRLVDACSCSWLRIIDLHPGPFRALAPLSVGVVRVRVTW